MQNPLPSAPMATAIYLSTASSLSLPSRFFPSAAASIGARTTLLASTTMISHCHLYPSVATSPASHCTTLSYCSTRATTVATSPLLRHRSSLPKAISLLNHYNISSSLLPPLVVHSSVAIASDRHILLKGRHLCCLAYHNATFSSSNSSRTLLCNSRRLCPAALYLSFSLLLSSSSTTTTTTSFSPPAAIIVAQPYPR
ncbi:hypothetical protein GW17_00024335 [Ensete ventricosum]|nr:hypothetical protein GW17_00024335 [Ensete ventricosum]